MSNLLRCALPLILVLFSAHTRAAEIWIGDNLGSLGTVDTATGQVNIIGQMGVTMLDIAFDSSENLWGLGGFSGTQLYQINKTNATTTLVGSLGVNTNSLVFGLDGTLYTANTSLYSINTTTGLASLIGSGGGSYISGGDLAFLNGQFFLSAGAGTSNNLILLDPKTGAGSLVGSMAFPDVHGLSTDGIDLFGASRSVILTIDPLTGVGTQILDYSGQGLVSAFGSAILTESVSSVPVPAAVWLFGSALGLLGWMRRKTA